MSLPTRVCIEDINEVQFFSQQKGWQATTHEGTNKRTAIAGIENECSLRPGKNSKLSSSLCEKVPLRQERSSLTQNIFP
jgi:hypothetical protein